MKKLAFLLVPLFFCLSLTAQENSTVEGTVLDENGLPMPGVFILQTGTSNGCSTDLDGKFMISVPSDASLEISCMGYLTRSVPVSGRTTLEISLTPDYESLEEVVVVGYGTQKSKDLTAPVVTVTEASMQPSSSILSEDRLMSEYSKSV